MPENMSVAVRIHNIGRTIAMLGGEYDRRRNNVKKTLVNVTEDCLSEARANAPIDTGELADSGSASVRDRGRGRGFIGEVGFDTPYATRMHEKHYQAHDHKAEDGKKSVGLYRVVTKRGRGVMARQEVLRRTPNGMWVDSSGHKHGRQYMQRALDDNRAKYEAELTKAGEQ